MRRSARSSTRAVTSVPPPAAAGTISSTGLPGFQACARAPNDAGMAISANANDIAVAHRSVAGRAHPVTEISVLPERGAIRVRVVDPMLASRRRDVARRERELLC